MVRVPAINQQVGRSVQLQAPGVAPVQDQTGNQLRQLGRGLQIAGQGVQSLGDEIRDRDDNARTREADALFSDYVRQALNPNDGYRSQLGKAASEGYDAVRKGIEAKQRELAGTLRNDTQRQLFHRAAQARLGQAQGVIDGHAAQQTRAYEMAETAAGIEGRKADYQESLGNPRAMAMHMALMRQDIAELADMTGRGPKEAKRMLLEQETAMHGAALDGFIGAGDTASARDYFNANEKGMSVTARERARGIISKAEVGDRAQGLLLKHAGKSLLDVMELSDKEHAAGNISDKVRSEWVRRAENRALVTRRETNIREANALQAAQEMIALGPLPPDVQQELEDTDQQWKLDAWAAGDGTWKTSRYGFKQLLAATDRDLAAFKSAEEVFNTYRAEMSDRDLDRMVTRWKGVQVAIGKLGAVSDEDALKINRDKQLRVLYRKRLGGDVDAEKSDFDEADFERWGFDLESRAQVIMKEKSVGETAALNEAFEQMEALPTLQGKSLHSMSPSERKSAKVQTSFGVFDLSNADDENSLLDERLVVARRKLIAANNALIAQGKKPVELTDRLLYDQAHADVLAENKQTQIDAAGLKQRGIAVLRQRFRMMQDDPEVQREIRRNHETFKSKDVWGRDVTRSIPRSDNFLGQQYSPRERLMLMANERFGEELSAEFGLSPNEIGEVLQVMSGTFVDKRKGRGDVTGLPVVDPDPINHTFELGGSSL